MAMTGAKSNPLLICATTEGKREPGLAPSLKLAGCWPGVLVCVLGDRNHQLLSPLFVGDRQRCQASKTWPCFSLER